MDSNKKGAMDGILIMNKPQNCTSHDIVYQAKKILQEKVGHTGTLDPMATGVLPLLIGKGTLCSKYLINHDKTYQVLLQLGEKTQTADREGKIVEEKAVAKEIWEIEKLEHVFQTMIGEQMQVPPMYSAIKVKGKKLYEYARKDQRVEVAPRKIQIYAISIDEMRPQKNQIAFTVSCSKGTYIRSLCEDIAQKLNTVGYMGELKRTQVGTFTIEQAISLGQLQEIAKENEINKEKQLKNNIISIEKLFQEQGEIQLSPNRLQHFLNGVKLTHAMPDGVYRIYCQREFIGIGILKNELLKRDIVVSRYDTK